MPVETTDQRHGIGTFHARHHELTVSYTWSGIYDHPVESLFLSVGAFVVAVVGTGMSLRESMVFSAFSSVKACTDHSGYKFPWNPVDLFTTVGAAYHDKHHQRWGYKVTLPAVPFRLLFLIDCRIILPFTFNSGIAFWEPNSRIPKLRPDYIRGTGKWRK